MRDRMTYANVMSTIAVFLVLGGTAAAITKISGKQIVDRSIPASKIKRNSLTAKEVRTSATSLKTKNLVMTQSGRKLTKATSEGTASAIVRLQLGESATILQSGPFSAVAECKEYPVDNGVATNIWLRSEVDGTLVYGAIGHDKVDRGEKVSISTDHVVVSQTGTLSTSPDAQGVDPMMVTPDGRTFRPEIFYGNHAFGADCFAGASAIVSS